MKNNLFTFELGEITPGMLLENGTQKGDEYTRAGRSSQPDYLMKIYLKRNLYFEKEFRTIFGQHKKYIMSGGFYFDKNSNALMLIPEYDQKSIFVMIKYRNYALGNGANNVRKDLHKFKTEQLTEMYFLIEMTPGSSFECWGINQKEKRKLHYSDFNRI